MALGGAALIFAVNTPMVLAFLHRFQGTAAEAKIYLQCDTMPMPKNYPASGEIYLVEPHSADPINNNVGGLEKMFGPSGGGPITWSSPEKQFDVGYRCQVFDYGSEPLFDVRLNFDVSIRKVVKGDGGSQSGGETIASTQWTATFPKIDQGADKPFVFYFYNRFLPYFVQINLPPSSASFVRSSSSEREQVAVLGNSYGQPIFLNPQNVQ